MTTRQKPILILIISSIIIVLIALLWLRLNPNFEIGKYDTFEEALEKGVPYKIKDIIYTQKVNDITVVMYLSESIKEQLPLTNFDILAVTFFIGNDQVGWENIGPNGWDHYENDNMTLYFKFFNDHDREGNYIVYGEINNPIIEKVETRNHQNYNFNEAKIIKKNGKRYYFKVGRELIVRGLSKDGKIVDQQGG